MPSRETLMPNTRLLLALATIAAVAFAAPLVWAADAPRNDSAVAQVSAPAPDKDAPPRDPKPSSPGRDSREGREGSGGHLHPSPIFSNVTDEDIAAIMTFVDANMPWLRPELDKMRDSDADRYRQVMRHLRFEIGQLKELREHNPEAFRKALEERQLQYRAYDLAAKARAATDPKERDAFVEQLRAVAEKLVDAEIVTREAQVRQLEQRLDTLRQELKQREAARQQIIQSRLDELLKGKAPSPLAPEKRPHSKSDKGDKGDPPDKGNKSDAK